MKIRCRSRSDFATACGVFAVCWLCVSGQEARAGLFRHWFLPATETCTDYMPSCAPCCPPDAAADPGADPVGADTSDPAGGDPGAGDPGADDPRGGPGAGGPFVSTGSAFGSGAGGGGSGSNRIRRTSFTGASGFGAGGFGGSAFFGGGILPVAAPAFGSGTLPTSGPESSGPGGGEGTTSSGPGTSLANPVLPDPGTTYVFDYHVTPGGLGNTSPLFFDPPVASGYHFQIISGPNFASVEVPLSTAAINSATFTLTFGTMSESLVAGTPFFFTSVFPGGVSAFTITGDFGEEGPDQVVRSLTFDTAISFVDGGDGSFSQTPIFANPEPGSLTLVALGIAGLFARRRQITLG